MTSSSLLLPLSFPLLPPPFSSPLEVINSVTVTSSSQVLNVNDRLTLQCSIPTSVPNAQVAWSSSNGPFPADGRVGVTSSGMLVYSYLVSGDTGTLTCTVANSVVGSLQTSNQFSLTVISRTYTPTHHPHTTLCRAVTVSLAFV